MRKKKPLSPRNQQGFIPLIILTVLTIAGVGGTGTIVASQVAVPGDRLYPVKTLTENIRLATSFGEDGQARTQLAIAEEKIREIEKLRESGDDGQRATEAAQRYSEMISSAAQNVASTIQSGQKFDPALAELVTKATSIHLTVLEEAYEKAPDQAKPSIEKAIQEGSKGQEEALKGVSPQRRQEVEQEVGQKKQEVQKKLDILREDGKPVPDIPQLNLGAEQGGSVQQSKEETKAKEETENEKSESKANEKRLEGLEKQLPSY